MGLRAANPTTGEELAAVYACQALIANSVAPVRIRHVRYEDGVPVEIPASRKAAVLARPNHYQTGLEFRSYAIHCALSNGNAYAWKERDAVGRVVALHPIAPDAVAPERMRETGDIYYRAPLNFDEPVERPERLAQRDVWHWRPRTTRDPLCGISPLQALIYVRIMQGEIQQTSAEFFANKAQNGGYLATDANVSEKQAKIYLASWERAARERQAGRAAFLDKGIKWHDQSLSATDAALIDQYRLTVEEIARAYGVPGWMIGLGDPSYSNAETMDRTYHAQTLRFYFDSLEASLGMTFNLSEGEAFDHAVEERIAKSDTKSQIEGLARAVQGGIMTPNEARKRLGLPKDVDGDTLLVQQQMIPVGTAIDPPEPIAPRAATGLQAVDDDADDDADQGAA
jgi:HK97 family phage portal protein